MTKKLMIGLGVLAGIALMAGVVSTCQSEYRLHPNPRFPQPDTARLSPEEMARKDQEDDSLRRVAKAIAYVDMKEIVTNYQPLFKGNKHSGYFFTDMNSDSIPELWVLTGNPGETFRLELHYPMDNGTIKRSFIYTGFGTYYRGDKYLKAAVKNGPDYLSIDKITIRKGEIYSDELESFNLSGGSQTQLPRFEEKEIHPHSFSNLKPFEKAFGLE